MFRTYFNASHCHARPISNLLLGCALALTILLVVGAPANGASDDVLTQHNDNARHGAQLHETTLKPSNVTAATFGRLYERQVDGQIIAQPLYVGGLAIPGKGTHNVVFVVTRKNTVYAFNADNLDTDPTHGLLWSHPITIEPAGNVPGLQRGVCSETLGPVGVTSTPVIDRARDSMYLVARKSDGTIWLHVLDITTGAPKAGTPGAVQIKANIGGMVFNQGLELNRSGLLLTKGAIVMGFSALVCDNQGWHGWVLAYRASDLAQVGVFSTTGATGWGGGIWAAGKGMVSDDANGIYFQTGNGSVGGGDHGESFVKLTLGPAPNYGLTFGGAYTVSNWAALNGGDTDLGASGPLLLPNSRLAGGGKQGKVYVINTQTMQPSQNGPAPGPAPEGGSDGFQAFVNTWHDDSSQRTCMAGGIVQSVCYMPHPRYEESELAGPNLHSGPIYWNGKFYAMPEKDFIRAFDYNTSSDVLSTTPSVVSSVRPPDGMPGGALSLSANGNSNGIIWALMPKVDGQWQNGPGWLIAFDATTLKELWRDDDDIAFSKFTPPTIAGGKVFRPTFANKLVVYGEKSGQTAIPCYDIAQVYDNYTGAEGILDAATDAERSLPDGGKHREYKGGAIYWTATTCAHEVHSAIFGKWLATGLAQGFLGYPVTNQQQTPNSLGEYNHFQNGSIYWTPNTGAHEVHGLIRDKWSSLGWENSALGFPVSDETDEVDGSGRFNLFEHGSIHWKKSDNSVSVDSEPSDLIGPQQGGADRPGADYSNFNLPAPNPAMCEERCAHDATCKAWSYVAPNTTQGPSPHCWLKNAIPVTQASNCCVTGVKVELHPSDLGPMQGAYDRPGNDFANFDLVANDPYLCQGECAQNAECQAWAYVQAPKPHCWLKKPAPPLVANNNVTAGARLGVTAAGGGALYQMHKTGTVWSYLGTPCNGDVCPSWQMLDDNGASVALAAARQELYQLQNSGEIWRYTGTPCSGQSCGGWQMLDDNSDTASIAAGGAHLYQLHKTGKIWLYTGTPCNGQSCTGWQMLDDNAAAVAIAATDSALYQLHNTGKIWRYTGTPCSGQSCPGWQMLDDNAAAAAIAAEGADLYQLQKTGEIWRYTGTPCNGQSCSGWQRLDDNKDSQRIVAAKGGLYQLHRTGLIWRYTGTPCAGDTCTGWQMLDNNPKAVAIAASGGDLYQLHNDGEVWQYTGAACNGQNCPGWLRLDDNADTKSITTGGVK
jgi:hypothetical protein